MDAAEAALDLFDDIEAAYPTFDRSEYATCSCQEHNPQIWELSDDPLIEWINLVYNFLVQAVKWIEEQLTFPDLLLIQSNGFLDFFSGRIYSAAVVATKIKHCWDIIESLTPADDVGLTSALKAPQNSLFAHAINDLDSLKSRIRVLDYARIADCHLEAYCSAFPGSGDENRGPEVEKQVNAVQDMLDSKSTALTLRTRKVLVKFLYKAAKNRGILPKRFYLQDVKRTGEHPFGCGSFGDVYKGQIGNQRVAVKVCRFFWEPAMKDERYREICREAFIWKPLEHPNVLPFLGICTDDFPSIGLVSPFMDNGNMLNYIKRKPDIDKLEIVAQICSGLAYLHTRKPEVVHGDLKCANILVDDAGRPQIADFGLAQATNIASATASTRSKGTLRWQAPELVYPGIYGGDGRVNTKTDMYAFGMICLEIFKEDIPFREKTDWEVVTMARDGVALERALEMTKSCSWVSAILERCCSIEPDVRSQATDIFMNGKLSARLSRPEDMVDSNSLSYSKSGSSLARLMRGGK
ncbi:hypothetical protein ACEPAH_2827 [Sanghuangporus vaninii]